MAFEIPVTPNTDRYAIAAGLLNCFSYAVQFRNDAPTLIWHSGTLSNLTVPPIVLHANPNNTIKIADADVKRFEDHIDRLTTGNKSEVEYRLILADGSLLWLREAATPIHGPQGNVMEIVGSIQDISKTRAPAGGGTDEGLFRKAFHQSEFGLAIWDAEDCLVTWNPKFEEHFLAVAAILSPGMTSEAFFDALAANKEIYSGSEPELWAKQQLSAHRGGRSSELTLPDGRFFAMNERPIARVGCVTIVNDVSSQRRGERALQQARELAELANATKSRFLRAANHDLRQPLATIKILTYNCIEEEDISKTQEMLHAIDVSTSIMEDILSVLLQVGQLDAGKVVPMVTNFQIAPFLERVRTQFESQAREKGLELRIISNQATIQSDHAMLERIVSNFVANAIRYTAQGRILVGCRKRGNTLRIEVHDTGCGIKRENLSSIFEEFFQVRAREESKKMGLGLGLNIAARMAQMLEHKISVDSVPGKGSVFSIDVPLGNVWQSDIGVPEVSEAIGGQFAGICAIVLEDDDILRGTISTLLERWGIEVTSTESRAAFDRLVVDTKLEADILLADYRLGVSDTGTQAAKDLSQLYGRPVPTVIMTADTDPKLVEEIKADGFPLLIKPISPPQLRVLMHNLLFEPDLLNIQGS
ncbi:ATP-binding protein [Roseobacter weihaiensis]|uniref:ATP-binding protein n=1 Tax=Roseobacter weihaiensis TaxID=2763262 RepID=UPI001D0A93EE|nr:ATP-binding protein [Roseobacter sp. H9]